jgi:S-adenosylmethionine hydrolase
MARPIISLTTDFGQADGYVGTMKGVILGICPEAALVDISHEIRPQAVRQAAYVLSTAVPYFPAGAVHLVVVDPGVGSDRRPIAVQTQRAIYVAPDNGVLNLVLARDAARLVVHLEAPGYCLSQVSATFHGRDIFAPAAAHLACGADPRHMGALLPASDLVHLPNLTPTPNPDGSYQAHVLHIDRFGNLVTNIPLTKGQTPISNIPPTEGRTPIRITIGREQITGLHRTFADVPPGALLAYVGSSGYLEIAEREGNASARLGVDLGDPVHVEGLA